MVVYNTLLCYIVARALSQNILLLFVYYIIDFIYDRIYIRIYYYSVLAYATAFTYKKSPVCILCKLIHIQGKKCYTSQTR